MKVIIALIENYHFTLDPVSLGIPGIAATARKIEEWGSMASSRRKRPARSVLSAARRGRAHAADLPEYGNRGGIPRSPMVTAQMAWDLQRFSGAGSIWTGHPGEAHKRAALRYAMDGTAGPAHAGVRPLPARDLPNLQNNKQPTYFEGKYYKYTMSPPVLTAGPSNIRTSRSAWQRTTRIWHGSPASCATGCSRTRCARRSISMRSRPQIEAGARKAGRPMSEIDILGAPIIVTGKNAAELKKERQLLKRRVAFTPPRGPITRCLRSTAERPRPQAARPLVGEQVGRDGQLIPTTWRTRSASSATSMKSAHS